jgi:hypothetical protein
LQRALGEDDIAFVNADFLGVVHRGGIRLQVDGLVPIRFFRMSPGRGCQQ